MKIISIGSDRNLFTPGSDVATRVARYAESVEETKVIVFSKKSLGFKVTQISPKLTVYPTNSISKFTYISDAIKLAKKLNFKADIVTCQDPFEAGLTGWRIAKKIKAKLHLQIHTDLFNPYFKKQSFLNRIRILIAKYVIPKANQIRVVSQRIKDSLLVRFKDLKASIEIQPVFINLEKLKSAPVKSNLHEKYPQFEKIILMASRLTWEKNIGLAIEAMATVASQNPKIGLIIVGSGPEEVKLKNKVKRFGLDKYVIFEGWSDDLPSYYKTADLFLLTSYYEGYGMTLVEANACGCPIVSTDVGIAGEVANHICPVGDDQCLISKIAKILK